MAIENEFKFILQVSPELRDMLRHEEIPDDFEYGYCDRIEQFYLSDHVRFRHVPDAEHPHIFTFKQMIDGRLLEIETPVSAEDFDLAKKAATHGLKKERHVVYEHLDEGSLKWEIDFLFDGEEQYFALVEIEVPEDSEVPLFPPFLKPYLVQRVPQEHNIYFTNFRLTDVAYARTAVEEYRRSHPFV